jgi:hypothetical protein
VKFWIFFSWRKVSFSFGNLLWNIYIYCPETLFLVYFFLFGTSPFLFLSCAAAFKIFVSCHLISFHISPSAPKYNIQRLFILYHTFISKKKKIPSHLPQEERKEGRRKRGHQTYPKNKRLLHPKIPLIAFLIRQPYIKRPQESRERKSHFPIRNVNPNARVSTYLEGLKRCHIIAVIVG